MKNFFLKTGLTLLCLIIGLGSAWGETKTLTVSSTAKFGTSSGSTMTQDGVTWTVTTNSGAIQNSYQTAYHGQQFGVKATPWSGTFFTNGISGTITSVKVDANTGGAATLAVTVGGQSFKCNNNASVNVTKNSSANAATWYEFTGSATGSIEIALTGTNAACYFGGVVITYTQGSTATHTAHFSINGTIDNTKDCTVAEGAAITLPSDLDDINGKKFMGWVSSPIDGTTNEAPDFVTSATMGTSDVTYYAVYATASGSEQTYHLTQNEIKESTARSSYSDITVNSASGTWTGKAIVNTATGYIQINKNSSNYNLCTPEFSAPITKIDIYTTNNTQSGRTFYLRSDNLTAQPSSSPIGSASLSEAAGSVSINVNSPQPLNQLYIYSSGAVYISNIDVTCGSASYSAYCTTVDTSTPSITADNTLEIPAAETDGTFNVTWTGMEDVDVNLYNDVDCTEDFTGDWFIAEVNSANQNIDYLAGENTSTSPRTVYMQLYGLDSEANEYTHVVTVTQAGKQGDPEITNFIKTSTLELVVGAPDYDIRNCLNIPNDYDTSTYSITTTINGLTQKDGEYACVYPYIAFSKAGEYTVHVVAAAMPGKYAQTEGDITVTVTDPAPAITTIPDLFTKATEVGNTKTDIKLTFDNWVVSGVKGSNAYVTDGTNGFIIYQSDHGFTAGNVLSGTVDCKVYLYNGAADIVGLTSSTTGLTVSTASEELTPTVISDISTLSGVNTGALIKINNVQYNGTTFTDGTNEIKPYNSIMTSLPELTNGTYYNVTGVYVQYNGTKEIAPRSADDVEEIQAEKYAITIDNNITNGTVTASLEEAAEGVEVTLTVTPATGYQLATLTVTNASTSEAITVTGNKFTMPAADVNVTATFEEATPSDNIFYESFDDNDGKGGNDDLWSGSIANKTLQFDNTGWDCTSGNGANQCAKFGAGSKKGSATTPALNYTGNATLTFKAGAWNGTSEGTTLYIGIVGDGTASPTSITLTKGEWTEYTITLAGLTADSKIKFEAANASNNRFFLDEIKVMKSSTPPASKYDVTIASDIEHGTIEADKAKAEEGDDITITATPDSGYHLATLYYTIDGDETQNTIENLTFTMPASNVTVHATFAEDVKYTVTIETPTNGTLVVKHGDDVVTSGEQFAENEVLDITATPAEGYKFRNWQAVDGTTHTFTSGTKWTMTASDVTIKANFDPADQKYLISWNVNGTVTNQQVDAGSTLVAPTMTGKTLGTREFVGWTEDALVKNDTIPTYVTLGTATKDVTYYAVFADREEVTAAVPTSITAYADGNYYLVDKYVVGGVNHYYALDGNINSNNFIIPTDITAAVTENPNGSITIDESNPIIKDAMKYSLSLTVEGNDSTIILRNLLTNKVINKVTSSSNANNLTNNEDAAAWTHFYAMPHRDADAAKSLPEQFADPNRFTLSNSTSAEWESHAIFMQYSSWNSTDKVQDVSPRVKAYAVSNRGVQPEKAQCYSAGYLYFVPATPIALSNFATHEVSVSQYGSTTLCMPEDYVMPEGLTGKIVTAKENLATPGYYSLTIVTKYNAGDVVPAGECLVLSGEQDSYYIAPGEASSSASVTEYPDNLLRSDYVIDTEDSKLRFKTNYEEGNASSYYYYKLTTKNSANFGWYWGVDGGAPFWMTSNERTYLVIDKEIANKVRGFALDECNEEDITTFINGLVTEEINRSGRIYNLQGQMVNKLQKGINIVNGKKVIR